MEMVVAVSNPSRMTSLSCNFLFRFKGIYRLTCIFAVVCTLTSRTLADEENLEEFLKREYSLAQPYRGLGFSSSAQWDLMGMSMVTTDHVRLTPDMQSRQGAVWSRIPLVLRDWELRVHFKIHGQGKKNLNGDGMAVWLTKDRMQDGMVFGNMNQFVGLGVFVDTYPNAEKTHDRAFPYVSVMLGNGTLTYEHDKDGRNTELGGCTAMVRNVAYDTLLLIKYLKKRLTVKVDVDGNQVWKDCADITGLHLPTGYFLGASSLTGDLSDNHDIISMKLYQLTPEKNLDEEEEEEEEEEELLVPRVDNMEQFHVEVEEEGMSSVQLFVTLLFTVLGIGVLAAIGLIVYGRWKGNRRKRFY